MKYRLKNNKTLLGIVFLGLVALFLPITLLLLRDARNLSSNASLPDQLESEQGILSSTGVSKQNDSGASGGSYVLFNNQAPTQTPTTTTPPDPSPPAQASNIYGSGIIGDGKGNAEIGRSWGDISFRFRAHSSAAPTSVSWSRRTGSGGYSGGDGGRIRIGIQKDDGTSDHHPDNNFITYTDISPGNPGSDEEWLVTNFSNAPSLEAGKLYHVVFKNISSDPYTDWVSANCLSAGNSQFGYYDYAPRQPAFADTDLEFLRNGPSNWQPLDRSGWYTPFFDLELADGTHEGNAYGTTDYNYDRLISGTSQMVRERFKVSGGDKTVTGAYVVVGRMSGSGNVTIRLEDSNGNELDSVTDSGSYINTSTAGERKPILNWVGGDFSKSHVLTNGSTYRLRVHSSTGSTYFTRPAFWEQRFQNDILLKSWHFPDGISSSYGGGEYTTDGGSSWNGLYHHSLRQDMMFYFTLQ